MVVNNLQTLKVFKSFQKPKITIGVWEFTMLLKIIERKIYNDL